MQVMLFYYYTEVKMKPSNSWVDMMYSIVEFKMMLLEELLGVLSINRRIFVTFFAWEKRLLSEFFSKWGWFQGHNEHFPKYFGVKL